MTPEKENVSSECLTEIPHNRNSIPNNMKINKPKQPKRKLKDIQSNVIKNDETET